MGSWHTAGGYIVDSEASGHARHQLYRGLLTYEREGTCLPARSSAPVTFYIFLSGYYVTETGANNFQNW